MTVIHVPRFSWTFAFSCLALSVFGQIPTFFRKALEVMSAPGLCGVPDSGLSELRLIESYNKGDGSGATSAAMAAPLFCKKNEDFFVIKFIFFFLHFNSYILLRKSIKVIKRVKTTLHYTYSKHNTIIGFPKCEIIRAFRGSPPESPPASQL